MAVFLSGAQNLAGASHDGLDIAKMGRLEDQEVGQGGSPWKGGHRVERRKEWANVQRWADMALQVARVAGELDRQGVRNRGGGGMLLAATATIAKKQHYLPKYECLVIHNSVYFMKHSVGWIFSKSRMFLSVPLCGVTPVNCSDSNTSLSCPGSCSCHARASFYCDSSATLSDMY